MQNNNIESNIGAQFGESYKITSDKYIILVDNRNQQRLIKLSANKKFNWRKTQINLEQLKTKDFYQLLQVGNNTLKPIQFENPDEESDRQQNQQENQNKDEDVKQNNKEMYTLEVQEAQKLRTQDIEKLKKQKRPEDIINDLIENNQQFQKRTAYSKAKYLKKKQRKYIFNFHAEPICLENIHDYYFKNDLKWIGGIRWDAFALLLLHGGPYRKVLLSEKTKGILLAATIIKSPQSIDFVSFEEKSIKNFPLVEQMNIENDLKNRVDFHTWESLKSSPTRPSGFTNFILLGNYDFSAIVDKVEQLKLLGSNASIAFFCLSLEPILDCYNKIRKNHKNYLNLKMFDSWCRQYQVLKNRTHPLMHMDSRSGYLLTAIRVNEK